MPTNVVKTKEDEKKWSKAKAIAAKEGHKDDWAYINGIYQNMKGEKKKESSLAHKLAQMTGEPKSRKPSPGNGISSNTAEILYALMNDEVSPATPEMYKKLQSSELERLYGGVPRKKESFKQAGETRGVPDATGPYGRGLGPGMGTASGLGTLSGLSEEELMQLLQMLFNEAPGETAAPSLKESAMNVLMNAKPVHEDNEKAAGVLDTLARKSPAAIKPMLQKLMLIFKYPELHAQLAQTSKFTNMASKSNKDIIKNLLKNNKDLFKQVLKTQEKMYSGKQLNDLMMRESQIPTLTQMLREGDAMMYGMGL